jgi:hypothetical protein
MPNIRSHSCRVLTYGRDEVLLKTRQDLLKTIGIKTDVSLNADEFPHCITASERGYDLFILCHTVPEQERELIVEAADGSNVEIYVLNGLVLPVLEPRSAVSRAVLKKAL